MKKQTKLNLILTLLLGALATTFTYSTRTLAMKRSDGLTDYDYGYCYEGNSHVDLSNFKIECPEDSEFADFCNKAIRRIDEGSHHHNIMGEHNDPVVYIKILPSKGAPIKNKRKSLGFGPANYCQYRELVDSLKCSYNREDEVKSLWKKLSGFIVLCMGGTLDKKATSYCDINEHKILEILQKSGKIKMAIVEAYQGFFEFSKNVDFKTDIYTGPSPHYFEEKNTRLFINTNRSIDNPNILILNPADPEYKEEVETKDKHDHYYFSTMEIGYDSKTDSITITALDPKDISYKNQKNNYVVKQSLPVKFLQKNNIKQLY